jgi:ADP-glucose pyrophosphorylase
MVGFARADIAFIPLKAYYEKNMNLTSVALPDSLYTRKRKIRKQIVENPYP